MIGSVLGLALYHRIPRTKTLDNANRQRVFDAIREQPGVRVGTIAAQLGLNQDTVRWHVRVLERFRLVESTAGAQRRYFAAGSVRSSEEKAAAIASSHRSAKRILEHVRARGEVSFEDLAASLDMPCSTASWSVSRLERAGLVRKERKRARLFVSIVAAPLAGLHPQSVILSEVAFS